MNEEVSSIFSSEDSSILNMKIVGYALTNKYLYYVNDSFKISKDDVYSAFNTLCIEKALLLDKLFNIKGIFHNNEIITLGGNKSIIQSRIHSNPHIRFCGYNIDKAVPKVCDIAFNSIYYCKEFINTGLYTDGFIIEGDYKIIYVLHNGKLYSADEYIIKVSK